MIGNGTPADPFRPMFAPAQPGAGGIIGFTYEVSDDGKSAIVEFTGRDWKSLAPVLESRLPQVRVFRKGYHTRTEIEEEFRKHKRDFDANRFMGVGRE
jgi:hypothetical protein